MDRSNNPSQFDLPWWMCFVVIGGLVGPVLLLGIAAATLHPPVIVLTIAWGAGTFVVIKGLRSLAAKLGTPPSD
ncbi:MAG: hypothetical protein JO291_15070 [Acidimicrobiia bacterium]|nr:hypothetical protein [Acidimicrobiia bacterium]